MTERQRPIEHRLGRIVVVGAGVGGLTAALLLAGFADELILLERRSEPGEVGAGIMLQPNGLAVLDGLGLGESVRRLGRAHQLAEVRNRRGELLSRALTPHFGADLDHFVAVLRSAVYTTLLGAVSERPAITTRFGATVTASAPDGRVWVGAELVSADLVVGADGVGSVVRSAGGFGGTVHERPTTYVRALVPGAGEGLFAEYWTPLGAFGAAPVADDLVYCYAGAYREPAAAAVRRRDLDGFVRAWDGVLPLAGSLLGRVNGADALLVNGVRRVRCRTWVAGRTVLLGDAAHAMAPNLGQGANSAMVDAAVLAAEIDRQSSVDGALAAYDARRRPAVTRLQSIADTLASLSGVRGRAPALVRDLVLRAASRPGSLDRQIRAAQQEDPAALRRSVEALAGH